MIRDITIGQYYPIDSRIHRLDPRTKLFFTMIFIIALFIADDVYSYLLSTMVLCIVLLSSRVPLKFMFRGLKSVIMLLLMSVGFNMFLTPGEVIWKFYIFTVTKEGLKMAIFMGLRLIYLVLGSSVLTLTTTPNALTDGMEKGLGFLKRFSVPVHEIAMMMSIALRFIPILLEETDKIMKAQMARGADFTSGGVIARAKAMIPLLVPLFISAIRRATDLAMAMEARCYHGGNGRTKMKPLKYKSADHIVYVFCILYLLLTIAIRVFRGRYA